MSFFSASKILWSLVAPSHVLLWTVIAAALLLLTGRQQAGRRLAVITVGLLIAMGALPSYTLLLHPLEYRYPRPSLLPAHVDGILTLGGVNAKGRLMSTYLLSKAYPDARVVFSGGSGALIDNQPGQDARVAKQTLLGLGLDPRRLSLEERSRNTWENILYTQTVVHPKPSETWLLAISAFQIPRTLEVACRLHWKLLPWPTNHMSQARGFADYFRIPENLSAFDRAVHEWIGLYAYRWAGKSTPLSNCLHLAVATPWKTAPIV